MVCGPLQSLIKEEIDYGLRDVSIYSDFMKNLKQLKTDLNKRLYDIKAGGGIIFGIGAATKGNTLLNFCKINYNQVKCILDNSPHKIGKYMPGSGIKIIDEKKFKKYDAAIILPWNITKHLYKKFLKNRKISYTSIAKVIKKNYIR